MSVGTVAFISLNSCSCQRVLTLVLLRCLSLVRRVCILDVGLVRFRARACDFLSEVLECCMIRNCGAFGLLNVRIKACAVCQR